MPIGTTSVASSSRVDYCPTVASDYRPGRASVSHSLIADFPTQTTTPSSPLTMSHLKTAVSSTHKTVPHGHQYFHLSQTTGPPSRDWSFRSSASIVNLSQAIGGTRTSSTGVGKCFGDSIAKAPLRGQNLMDSGPIPYTVSSSTPSRDTENQMTKSTQSLFGSSSSLVTPQHHAASTPRDIPGMSWTCRDQGSVGVAQYHSMPTSKKIPPFQRGISMPQSGSNSHGNSPKSNISSAQNVRGGFQGSQIPNISSDFETSVNGTSDFHLSGTSPPPAMFQMSPLSVSRLSPSSTSQMPPFCQSVDGRTAHPSKRSPPWQPDPLISNKMTRPDHCDSSNDEESGLQINFPDKNGNSVLHGLALVPEKFDVYSDVIKTWVNLADPRVINAVNAKDQTPLYRAVKYQNIKMVELLLKCHADVNIPGWGKSKVKSEQRVMQCPLHVAVQKGNKKIVQMLLQADGVDVNAKCQGDGNMSPLTVALMQHRRELDRHDIVLMLIRHHADLEAKVPLNGMNAMMLAVETRDPHLVRSMLEQVGAGNLARELINAKNNQGNSCLHIAAGLKSLDRSQRAVLIDTLIRFGGDANISNREGDKPSDWAKTEMNLLTKNMRGT